MLAAGVAVWDVIAPRGEMLSDASARYTKTAPLLWGTTVVYVAGHLIHVWPKKYDLLSVIATAFNR